jgi:hypothetical protein
MVEEQWRTGFIDYWKFCRCVGVLVCLFVVILATFSSAKLERAD